MPAPRKACPYTRDELLAALRAAGGVKPLATSVGVSWHTVHRWRNEAGITVAEHQPAAVTPAAADAAGDEWLLEALRQVGDNATIEELADHVDVSPRKVRDAAARLAARGFRVRAGGGNVVLDRVQPAPASTIVELPQPALLEGDRVRFGVVSDTHIGSREHRNMELQTAYHRLEAEGIRTVLHPGDMVAGRGIYRHQDRDLVAFTFDAQVDMAEELYPRVDGIETLLIGGNHDLEGAFGQMAADPCRALAARRDDITYLGEYDAWIELPNGAFIHMLHPGGGSSYALSYRAQKLCEGYEQGRKPAALLLGHYHRRGAFEARAIETLLCGTFEGVTGLAKRYGMGPPAIGFHIIEAALADDGSLVDWNPRWFRFHTGRRQEAA